MCFRTNARFWNILTLLSLNNCELHYHLHMKSTLYYFLCRRERLVVFLWKKNTCYGAFCLRLFPHSTTFAFFLLSIKRALSAPLADDSLSASLANQHHASTSMSCGWLIQWKSNFYKNQTNDREKSWFQRTAHPNVIPLTSSHPIIRYLQLVITFASIAEIHPLKVCRFFSPLSRPCWAAFFSKRFTSPSSWKRLINNEKQMITALRKKIDILGTLLEWCYFTFLSGKQPISGQMGQLRW